MPSRSFKVSAEEFSRRGRTMIQHKLRVLLKCYTVYDFKMNEVDNTFSFKKSVRRNGIKRNDPKHLNGKFELNKLNKETSILKIWV